MVMSFFWMVEPQLAPRGTSVQSFSASEMEVSWNAIAWNRNTGRVLGYEVIHINFMFHYEYASLPYNSLLNSPVLLTWFLVYSSVCLKLQREMNGRDLSG